MFNKIGLGAILTFQSSQAETSIARTNKAFGGLHSTASRMAGAGAALGSSMTNLGFAMAPLVGLGTSLLGVYAKFTHQMAAVQAVGQFTGEELESLRARAMELGSTTSFTATQAAQGMEELARAGFNADEIYGAIGATLHLAAADALDLGKATAITTNIIRSMGLQAPQDAQRVADVLAMASAKTLSSVESMGEAFKMSAPTMRLLNIEFEEAAAILGKIHDAGLRGTTAGIVFNNMMTKLAKPTKRGRELMDKYGISITDANGKTKKMSVLTQELGAALNSIKDEGERLSVAMELTGMRGVRSLNALMNALDPKSGGVTLTELEDQLKNKSTGVAEQMAKDRLNSLTGQFTLLKSAAEGFVIRLFDMFKNLDGTVLKPLVDGLTLINQAWDRTNELLKSGATETEAYENVIFIFGDTVAGIVFGIRDGIANIQSGLEFITKKFQEWGIIAEQTFGADGIRKITAFITTLVMGATIAAPFMTVLSGIAWVVKSAIIPALTALGSLIAAVFWPAVAIATVLGIAFMVIRKEGETVGETLTRVWGAIKVAALDFYQNALLPLWDGMVMGWAVVWPLIKNSAMSFFDAVRDLIDELAHLWNSFGSGLYTDWYKIGKGLVKVVGFIVNFGLKNLTSSFKLITNLVKQLRQVVVDLGNGHILRAVGRLGQTFINVLLLPLRSIAGLLGNMMKTALDMPGVSKALGKDKAAKARTIAATMVRFGEEGLNYGDYAELPEAAPGYVDKIGEDKETDLERAMAEMEASMAETEASMAEQMAANMGAGISDAVKEGMESANLETTVNSSVCIDGKNVARNQAKHQQDLSDRLGYKTPPFARRMRAEQGQLP